MPISVNNQAYIFLWSIAGGMLIAFIYDAFRIRRKAVKIAGFLTHIEDFIYWILVAIIMFAVVYYSNEGELRGYIFIGTILGVILYVMLFSRIIMQSSLFIIRVVTRVVKTIWMIVTYPFRLLFKLLSYPGRFILKMLKYVSRGARQAGRTGMSKAAMWRRSFKNMRKKI